MKKILSLWNPSLYTLNMQWLFWRTRTFSQMDKLPQMWLLFSFDGIVERMRPKWVWWYRVTKCTFRKCTRVITVWTLIVSIGNGKREFKDLLGSFRQSAEAQGALRMPPIGSGQLLFSLQCFTSVQNEITCSLAFLSGILPSPALRDMSIYTS